MTDVFDGNEEVQVLTPSSLMETTKAEIDIQIATAKRYPRSIKKFQSEALTMATLNEEVAASCFYSKPQGGSNVEGPSARLAEIVASAWGNLRIASRMAGDEGDFIKCQAVCHDLERNVAASIELPVRITDRNGKRYGESMVMTTAASGISKAYRNAIFKIIPKAYWHPIYEQCRQIAVGDAKTLESKRKAMIDYFMKMGVTPDRIVSALGLNGIEDIGLDQLTTLKGYATALKEGDSQIEDIFPAVAKQAEQSKTAKEPPATKTDAIAEQLKAKKQAEEPKEAAPIDSLLPKEPPKTRVA